MSAESEPVDVIDTGVCDWLWDGRLRAMYGYDDGDLARFARLLSRPCPYCDAKPGDRCRTRSGELIADLDAQHVARHYYGEHLLSQRERDEQPDEQRP